MEVIAPETRFAKDSCSNLRLTQAFDSSAIGIAICHPGERILEANPALSRMLGYEQQGLYGVELHTLLDSDHREACRFLDEVTSGNRKFTTIDEWYRRRDGSRFWGHTIASIVHSSELRPEFLVIFLEDATDRKRVEDHLRQAEKMEVLGQLAGGIAHDFNNLLTGVLLYCDLLLAEVRDHKFREHVKGIQTAAEQGAALTQQLLAISRKQATQTRPFCLNDVVSSTEDLLRRLVGEQVQVLIFLDPTVVTLRGDPGQLRQVLLNLVVNARDAMPQGGTIQISTRAIASPHNPQLGPLEHAVSLAVEDSGCGMSAETRARLFEPFFTTKKPGEGTGMGLATVQRIVSEWRGWIEVESEVGCGTRIEVCFPVNTVEQATIPTFPARTEGRRHSIDATTLKPKGATQC